MEQVGYELVMNWWFGRETSNYKTWSEWKAKVLAVLHLQVSYFLEFKALKVLLSEMEVTVWEECFFPSLNLWKMKTCETFHSIYFLQHSAYCDRSHFCFNDVLNIASTKIEKAIGKVLYDFLWVLTWDICKLCLTFFLFHWPEEFWPSTLWLKQ